MHAKEEITKGEEGRLEGREGSKQAPSEEARPCVSKIEVGLALANTKCALTKEEARDVIVGGLRKGFFLDDIMQEYGISKSDIDELVQVYPEVAQAIRNYFDFWALRIERKLIERALQDDTTAMVKFLQARHPCYQGTTDLQQTVLRFKILQSGGAREKKKEGVIDVAVEENMERD